jgi:hypothetical protein
LPELDISGIMGVSLENALQRSSVQGNYQADVDGLTKEIIAHTEPFASPCCGRGTCGGG